MLIIVLVKGHHWPCTHLYIGNFQYIYIYCW